MYCPIIGERVRVSGRSDKHLIPSTDYTACMAVICLSADGTAINESVPFSLLFEATEFERAQDRAFAFAGLVATNHQVLQSSQAHIDRGRLLIAETQNYIARTWEIIRTSQHRMHRSDQVIARARTLDCI
jgi:hypothetical protein